MRPRTESRRGPSRRGHALLLAALLASACASPGAKPPVVTEVRDETGFTLTEELHVGGGVRADFERAVALLAQERYDEGIALLVSVTEAAPRATLAHIDLGMAYARVGKLEEAEKSFGRALALEPRNPVALNEQGIVYRRTGRFVEARQSYEKALAAYPEFHFARRNLAVLCDLYLADAACALEHYELYTRAVPDDAAVAMWMTDLRNRAGR